MINIDKIMLKILPGKKDNLNPKKLTGYIRKEYRETKGSKRVYIILGGWHENHWLSDVLKRKTLKKGYSFLHYKIKPEILSAKVGLTYKAFMGIKKKVIADIKKIKNKFSEIIFIGTSLHAISAPMIVNNCKEVNKIILVCPGHCLAESLWNGIRTQNLKEDFIKQGITLKKLKKIWKDLAPENNINKMGGKEIVIYNSQSDEVIPYWCGNRLVKKMRKIGINPIVKTNKYLGHYLTITHFFLFNNEILK